ncbi:hypothetical protein EXU57_10370 [Segetibacter sp. 3557_3]|uniref:YdeI/OmpD-associated family protein n=1 Tax=Segetibacter sp. 3557_3 TaxID=2547429 RepID=UPI0010584035|nr:YdeI/OmpD-associated family protein [Segetibacter sp. 3557_3]TDH26487.1 hypothetical protein EXU57_10370 [Segetibacter sp. 3557_3]
MPNTTTQKLKIKPGMVLRLLHAPDDFERKLHELPAGVKTSTTATNFDQVHWFVRDKSQLLKEINQVTGMLAANVLAWIYFPKGSSGIQTDLTKDTGWEVLQKNTDLKFLTLISFDGTWSAFGFRLKTAADEVKAAVPKTREIFKYVDPLNKTITLPETLEQALAADVAAKKTFDALSFTNKKEYVEWIVSAKRAETKLERVTSSIERLQKGWKNPANR